MNQIVQNIAQFKRKYKELVHELVQVRKQSNTNQEQMAAWLNVNRRKIIQFEGLKKVNMELLLLYGDKLSVDIKLNFEIN